MWNFWQSKVLLWALLGLTGLLLSGMAFVNHANQQHKERWRQIHRGMPRGHAVPSPDLQLH